jgi:dienelactone hydrolase
MALTISLLFLLAPTLHGQSKVPPWDLWTAQVITEIRDRSTLELSVSPQTDHTDVFFTSNPAANWFDDQPPYTEHKNEKIRIHGILVSPSGGVPRPALVIGHGHGGHADLLIAKAVANLGYVAFYIDGPQAGESTGGPNDSNQAWISVDKGPQYGFLYHYSYAGMRALTALEELAAQPGNSYCIDTTRFGVFGASMGGIFATYLNAVDDRVKAAIVMASAGNWPHALRYPNAWLYSGIYTGSRDIPYNGKDPLNSIEDVDWDATAITFTNYFDPIRYATRQHAPVLTLMGTHDQYFPFPSANLMLQAITSAGTREDFEKRLWLLPNKPHAFADSIKDLAALVPGLRGWLDYCFGERDKPLATPQVSITDFGSGLRFQISLAENVERLSGAQATLYAAMRVDSSTMPIKDFKAYPALRMGDMFEAVIPAADKSESGDAFAADNVIYYATVTDTRGLSVSSLVWLGSAPLDLSTGFVPTIDPDQGIIVPPPPAVHDAAVSLSSSRPADSDQAYQGMAFTNPTDKALAVRVEARTNKGRIAAGEGLINPIVISLAPRSQQVFVAEEWFGPGARNLSGSFVAAWSDARATSLSFRGNGAPSELDGTGPVAEEGKDLWLPLASDQNPAAQRRIRIFGGPSASTIQLIYRASDGDVIASGQTNIPARSTLDVVQPAWEGIYEPISVEIRASNPVSARLEVSGACDTWSIEARQVPTKTRYIQAYAEWYGAHATSLLFINPSDMPRRLNSRARMMDGSEVQTLPVTRTLGPLASICLKIEDAVGMIPGNLAGAGWLDLDSPDGPLIVVSLTMDSESGFVAASPIDAPGSGAWSLPFYSEIPGYWTGLAIANPGGTPAQITITAYDGDGQQLAIANAVLESEQSRVQLVYQWLEGLPAGTTGQIVITSDVPVQIISYFGTDDSASLAAIPLQIMK